MNNIIFNLHNVDMLYLLFQWWIIENQIKIFDLLFGFLSFALHLLKTCLLRLYHNNLNAQFTDECYAPHWQRLNKRPIAAIHDFLKHYHSLLNLILRCSTEQCTMFWILCYQVLFCSQQCVAAGKLQERYFDKFLHRVKYMRVNRPCNPLIWKIHTVHWALTMSRKNW